MAAFTLYVCIFLSCWFLHVKYATLVGDGFMKDVWLVRVLVQNGLAFYATWVTIATLLNLGACITYHPGAMLPDHTSSTICLGILAAELVVWFSLDMTVLDRFVRYLCAPYVVVVWALSGVIAKNWDPTNRNSIFSVVLLAVASTACIIKVAIMIWRHRKRPIYQQLSAGYQVEGSSAVST